jgi:hypothetical protein
MPRRDQRILLSLAALSLALAVVQAIVGFDGDLLLAVPALLLFLPLLGGRYVGEEGIARLADHLATARVRPSAAHAGRVRRAPRVLPRGGRLIAAALAQRGPPALLLAR